LSISLEDRLEMSPRSKAIARFWNENDTSIPGSSIGLLIRQGVNSGRHGKRVNLNSMNFYLKTSVVEIIIYNFINT